MRTTCDQQIIAIKKAMKNREIELRPRVSASFQDDYTARHQLRLMRDKHYNALNDALSTISALKLMSQSVKDIRDSLQYSKPHWEDTPLVVERHTRALNAMNTFIERV